MDFQEIVNYERTFWKKLLNEENVEVCDCLENLGLVPKEGIGKTRICPPKKERE